MSVGESLAIVVVVGAITYSMRASIIVLVAGRRLPHAVERSLRSVAPAVLAALAVNLAAGGDGGPHLELAEAAALAVGGVVALWRRHLTWALCAGMCALWCVAAVS